MADEKDGKRKQKSTEKKSRKSDRGRSARRDEKPRNNDRNRGKQRDRRPYQRRHGVRKTIKNGIGTVYIGQEDPFIYFPDIIALFARDDIVRVELRALGPAISNAVNVSEQVRHRFLKEADVKVANVEIGTDNVSRSSGKGTYRVSFIHISLERSDSADENGKKDAGVENENGVDKENNASAVEEG